MRFLRAVARTGVDPAAEPIADEVTNRIAAQAVTRELAAALSRLSQAQRDVLLLVASGLSYEEAALALEVPAGTVSSRLVYARRKVREALGGQDPTRPGRDSPE
jgi:RNA polymerase sigma-70 factor (ECF subfamily)